MVTNRSRAYPRRSGKRQRELCRMEKIQKELSMFGFEGTTKGNIRDKKDKLYDITPHLRSIFLSKIIFYKNEFFISIFLFLCYNQCNKYVKVFYNAVRWLNGL